MTGTLGTELSEHSSEQEFPELNEVIRPKVLELLKKPNAGSDAFRINHPDASYLSNCHGTMLYVLNIKTSKDGAHPDFISNTEMQEIIKDNFVQLDQPNVGDLLCFFQGTDLIHSALMIGQDQIFEQTGGGGVFQTNSSTARHMTFKNAGMKQLSIHGYRPRSLDSD